MDARALFIALYVQDVQENPGAYKAHVVADPAGTAAQFLRELDEIDAAQLLRDLKAERRLIAKHAGD